ncbi:MAG: hypothetical protein JXR18_05995 [Neptuniibacter sp.]
MIKVATRLTSAIGAWVIISTPVQAELINFDALSNLVDDKDVVSHSESGVSFFGQKCFSQSIASCIQSQGLSSGNFKLRANINRGYLGYGGEGYLGQLGGSISENPVMVIVPQDANAKLSLNALSLLGPRFENEVPAWPVSGDIVGLDENFSEVARVSFDNVHGVFKTLSLSGFDQLTAIVIDTTNATPVDPSKVSAISVDDLDIILHTAPSYSCNGFVSPMNKTVTVKKNRALPFKAILAGDTDANISEFDVSAPPVINLTYISSALSSASEVDASSPGASFEGNQFQYIDGHWQFNLSTKQLASGTYTVKMLSGDNSEYEVNPTCLGSFVIK